MMVVSLHAEVATGSRTITIKGGVAVVAHQSQSNPMYGTLGVELLSAGMPPQQAFGILGQIGFWGSVIDRPAPSQKEQQ